MDRVPQEIINHIISCVGVRVGAERVKFWRVTTLPLARPPIAAVSRKFQAAVEEVTFRMLVIDSTEIADLERMFDRHPARAQALKSLRISLVLPCGAAAAQSQQEPEKQQEEGDRYANDADRAANNAAVTTELEHLFNLLAKWFGDKRRVDLIISVRFSPKAGARQSSSSEMRYRFSLLDLVDRGNTLPPLPCVKRFVIRHGSSITWHPSAVATLTSRMTHAEHIDWQLRRNFNNPWGGYYAMDVQWREALVSAVLEPSSDTPIVASSVTDFTCAIMSPQAWHDESLPDLLRASNQREKDLVGRAVQRLSSGCEKLDYEGPLHTSFFDCAAGEETWDKLRELKIRIDIRGPHGRWYCGFQDGMADPSDEPLAEISSQMPPGYGATEQELEDALVYYEDNDMGRDPDYDIDYYHDEDGVLRWPRNTPVHAELNPLLPSFARTCARLPSLEMASLKFEDENSATWPLALMMAAPGKTVGGRNWDEKFARGDGQGCHSLHYTH